MSRYDDRYYVIKIDSLDHMSWIWCGLAALVFDFFARDIFVGFAAVGAVVFGLDLRSRWNHHSKADP